jgi:hypothetical protein
MNPSCISHWPAWLSFALSNARTVEYWNQHFTRMPHIISDPQIMLRQGRVSCLSIPLCKLFPWCLLAESYDEKHLVPCPLACFQDFMEEAKFLPASETAPIGTSLAPPPAEWFNKDQVQDVSPTNVADLFSSVPLAFTQSPKRVCGTPPVTPAKPTVIVPRRRAAPCPLSPPIVQDGSNRSKRRRKALTDTAATDDLAASSSIQCPSAPLRPNFFMSPERVLCSDYQYKARVAAALFSPGQEAAERLVALRHAFSPCKQRTSAR